MEKRLIANVYNFIKDKNVWKFFYVKKYTKDFYVLEIWKKQEFFESLWKFTDRYIELLKKDLFLVNID